MNFKKSNKTPTTFFEILYGENLLNTSNERKNAQENKKLSAISLKEDLTKRIATLECKDNNIVCLISG